MPNLQYIGARYVPKFYENSLDPSSMEWESNRGYEALTVVTENDDTYTSKIPVPATIGAPSANPTYWAKTAAFNAALVALQNAVNQIRGDVDTIAVNENNGFSGYQIDKPKMFMSDFSWFTGDSSLTSMQGSCYNPLRNSFVIGFVNPLSQTHGMLVEVNETFTNVVQRVAYNNNEIKHCNDIAFNATINRYIIAGLDHTNPTDNQVIIVDPTDLSIEETKQIAPVASDISEVISRICYDSDNEIYYAMSNAALIKYDASFNVLESNSWDLQLLPTVIDGSTVTWCPLQSIEYIDGKIAGILSVELDSSHISSGGTLIFYNPDGSIFTSYSIKTPSDCEFESVTKYKGALRLTGQGYGVTRTDFYLQNVPTADIGLSPFAQPATLMINDLDNLYTCGCYYKEVHNLVSNAPFDPDKAYLIYVISNGVGYNQIAVGLESEPIVALRGCNQLGVWRKWRVFPESLLPNTTYSHYEAYFGFLSGNAKDLSLFIPIGHRDDITASDITVSALSIYTAVGDNTYTFNLTNVAVSSIEVYDRQIRVVLQKLDGTTFKTAPGGNAVAALGNIALTIS